MKANTLCFVIVCAFVGATFGAVDKEKVLTNQTIVAVYSMPSKVWLEGVYNVGKPTAKIYAYMAFEGPYIASSAAFGVAGVKLGKDLLVEVAQEYIENPERVCENLADALMSVGMESYRRNYTRYKAYKATNNAATPIETNTISTHEYHLQSIPLSFLLTGKSTSCTL